MFRSTLSLLISLFFLSPVLSQENINLKEDFPVFPVCKLIPSSLQKNCFDESMQEHIDEFFSYPKTAVDLGLQAVVNVYFEINKNGMVGDINANCNLVGVKFDNKEALLAANQLFEKAAKDIFAKLPKMIPGKINDSISSFPFQIPITYRIPVKENNSNLVFALDSVEWAPLFPGCEKMNSDGSKTCFKEKVQNHINKYLRYPKKANTTEKDVVVFIEILIENDGVIYDLTSLGPNLFRQEAERVIKKLPYFEPALNNDIPVAVSYTIPILFNSKINK
jgi:hypothetical protein|tara:strand:- start:823 stop:1656 length:834 start_codon:yes stop_codon:yes gene_type:complete